MRKLVSRLLLWGQGLYYLITGVWPLLHMDSFVAVTGPKTDYWLVRTVALMIAAVAVTLLLAAYNKRDQAEFYVLALASAAGLSFIDIYYVSVGRISPIYLLDLVPEAVLIAMALYCLATLPRERRPT